jgi:hypothetical protein
MKKILLSLGVFTSISLSAQTIVNGGFESVFTPWEQTPLYQFYKFENSSTTDGWGSVGNGTGDATKKAEGKQSLKLVTANAPVLSTVYNEPNMGTVVTGVTDQVILSSKTGPFLNPDKIKLSFQFQYTKAGNDVGSVGFVIYDTLGAGSTDNKVLYEGSFDIDGTVSDWTTYTITPIKKADGNANRIYILALSSKNGYYPGTTPATPGATLWLDDVKFLNLVNVDENTLSDLKVYPNPATDVLKFETSEEIESVVISSIEGKVVREVKESSNVNVSDLKAGVYVYRVTTRLGKQSTANFIKE